MFYFTKKKIAEKGSKLYLWEPNEMPGLSKSHLKKLRVWLKSKVQRRRKQDSLPRRRFWGSSTKNACVGGYKQEWYIVKSISLSMRISLLVIRTNVLGYWDDNNWQQVNILSFRPKQLCFCLTWKISPLKVARLDFLGLIPPEFEH